MVSMLREGGADERRRWVMGADEDGGKVLHTLFAALQIVDTPSCIGVAEVVRVSAHKSECEDIRILIF